uniref:Uncharacterized protein n=1 Tax=Ananas comosus var. bracteatus TaxID=296719 RepID=A0A6V7NGK0_ANACO|nr:unnamed protein product [Ananas comosus var. bracteatus]
MCKENIWVPENKITKVVKMEADQTVLVNGAACSPPANTCCIEKIGASLAEEFDIHNTGPKKQAEKHENDTDLVSSQAPCLGNTGEKEDLNVNMCKIYTREVIGSDPSSSPCKIEDDLVVGCQTPTESIFDPFAPGPDELAFAPKKKMMKGTLVPLRRQLNFDLNGIAAKNLEMDFSGDAEEEDRIIELVCKSFLELIISNQVQEINAQNFPTEPSRSEGFKTPVSCPLLNGVADTCPAAPIRPNLKSKRLSPGICRKLDFGSNLKNCVTCSEKVR